MRYDRSLMEDMVRWYGLEAYPEFQHERNHYNDWAVAHMHVKLSREWKRAIKAYRATKI